MLIADMTKPDGRAFLKSVFGQISDGWPCVSFLRQSVGAYLRREFRPGRDVVIEPKQVLKTRKIISPENWLRRGERWPLSMAVTSAATLSGPPFSADDPMRYGRAAPRCCSPRMPG